MDAITRKILNILTSVGGTISNFTRRRATKRIKPLNKDKRFSLF
jgi:hypothetical protein